MHFMHCSQSAKGDLLRGAVLEDLVYFWSQFYGYCQAAFSSQGVACPHILLVVQVELVWRVQMK